MPGSVAQAVFGVGKLSAMPLGHGLRAGVQVARAGVVAEPGPGLEHVVERRRRERVDSRPARQEFARNRAPTAFTVVCCSMISDSHTR